MNRKHIIATYQTRQILNIVNFPQLWINTHKQSWTICKVLLHYRSVSFLLCNPKVTSYSLSLFSPTLSPMHPVRQADQWPDAPSHQHCFCLSSTCSLPPWPPRPPATPYNFRVQSQGRCLPPPSAPSPGPGLSLGPWECPACRPDTSTTA